MRREFVTWDEIDRLIDHIIPQFNAEFDMILGFTDGGIIPCGLISEALGIRTVRLITIDVPDEIDMPRQRENPRLIALPKCSLFPSPEDIQNKRILIVGKVWGSGRRMICARNKVAGAGGTPFTCALHFKPGNNIYHDEKPDFYAATTDAWIIYPWETPRDTDPILSS